MKQLFSILIFLISYNVLFGQEKVIDSLQLKLNQHVNNDSTKVKILINLSNSFIYKNLDSSELFVNQALKLASTLNWKKGIALSYRQKSIIDYTKPDYESGLNNSHSALKYSKDLNDPIFEATVYNNIANIYSDMKDFDKALENYNKLLVQAVKLELYDYQLQATYNIATVQTELENYKKAISNYKTCLQLVNKTNKPEQYLPFIYNNLARTYQYLHDNKNAVKYLKEGIEQAEKTDNHFILGALLKNLGEYYITQNMFSEAEKILLKSIETSKQTKSVEWESLAWEELSNVYEQTNKTTLALKAYKTHIKLRDSVINEEKKLELIKKDLQFESNKKDAIAQAEIKRQKLIINTSILGASGLILASIIGFILYKKKKGAVQQMEISNFKKQVAETELKALRAQLNPHFIFNSLNSINNFIDNNDSKEAKEYLAKFASIMRKTLENSEKKEIVLEDDLQLLKTYLEIEQKRLSYKFDFKFRIDDNIDTTNTLVPPLILQPFIENSIWHGITKKEGKGTIYIDVKQIDNNIIYAVEDDGVGLKHKTNDVAYHKKSFGMNIARNRVDIINKQKNSKGKVRVLEEELGVRVEVELPLELAF